MRVTVKSPLREMQRKVAEAAADLGKRYTVGLVMDAAPRKHYPTVRGKPRKGTPPTNAEVLARLQVHGRDVTEVTVEARGRLIRETLAALPSGAGRIPTASQLWLSIGARWRALVVERLEREGGDLGAPANADDWTRYKGRVGLATTRLRASGQLVAAVRAARVEIRGR